MSLKDGASLSDIRAMFNYCIVSWEGTTKTYIIEAETAHHFESSGIFNFSISHNRRLCDLECPVSQTVWRSGNHIQFKEIITALRPGYKPLTSSQIGGRLLENSYDDILQKQKNDIEGKTVSMSLDDRSNRPPVLLRLGFFTAPCAKEFEKGRQRRSSEDVNKSRKLSRHLSREVTLTSRQLHIHLGRPSPNKAMKVYIEPASAPRRAVCVQLSVKQDAWKEAITVGIPKPEKSRDFPTIYRPISLLSDQSSTSLKNLMTLSDLVSLPEFDHDILDIYLPPDTAQEFGSLTPSMLPRSFRDKDDVNDGKDAQSSQTKPEFLEVPNSSRSCTPRTRTTFRVRKQASNSRSLPTIPLYTCTVAILNKSLLASKRPPTILCDQPSISTTSKLKRKKLSDNSPSFCILNAPIPWHHNCNYLEITLDKHLHFKNHTKRIRQSTLLYLSCLNGMTDKKSKMSLRNKCTLYKVCMHTADDDVRGASFCSHRPEYPLPTPDSAKDFLQKSIQLTLEEREIRVVLRGVPKKIPVEEVKEDLLSQNIPVQAVRRISINQSREPLELVLVTCTAEAKDKRTKAAFFKIKSVYSLSGIKAEQPRKRALPGQCHNCQSYRH
ncbi:hypothetical protein EVAR_89370_1 [Eumeta japonica]|uniref:Pre-C2HC domain-containing protein n=1 Tax=Eumeta variegata TaxID=151549 RepID=A0A4C1ZMZ0_EUMVA|nr:hypothetical protein EVAR_89370_1 [Eumeta japonica]